MHLEQEHDGDAGEFGGSGSSEAAKAVAAAVIAAGGSYSEAAQAAGRSKRTIVRWMADPAFARQVADLRAERLSEVAGRLAEMAPRAVDVLADALEDEKAWVRLRAATDVLSWSIRLRRAADLEARMLEVERRQGIRPASDTDDETDDETDDTDGDERGEVA
jgi:hypothetical protein